MITQIATNCGVHRNSVRNALHLFNSSADAERVRAEAERIYLEIIQVEMASNTSAIEEAKQRLEAAIQAAQPLVA